MKTAFDYLRPTEEEQELLQLENCDSFSVNFRCGHTHVITLYGDYLEGMNQKSFMEECCLCPKCALNQFENYPRLSFDQSLEISGMFELPSLRGHVKAIKKAMIIRAQVLSLSNKTLWYIFDQEYQALQMASMQYGDYVDRDKWWGGDVYEDTFQYVLKTEEIVLHTDAAWWLARQEYAARELCNNFVRRRSYDTWKRHIESNKKRLNQ